MLQILFIFLALFGIADLRGMQMPQQPATARVARQILSIKNNYPSKIQVTYVRERDPEDPGQTDMKAILSL